MFKSILFIAAGLSTSAAAAAGETCGSSSYDLIAGQTFHSGSLDVSHDDTSLTVTYVTTGGWQLDEVQLHVGCSLDDIPQSKSGNPKVGNFDYKATLDPAGTSYTFEIDLDGISCLSSSTDNTLVIAAHAAVHLQDVDGSLLQGETAWSEGAGSAGRSWAMYSSYTVTPCEPPVVEEGACTEPGDFRTQTQGGWGTECNGNNPGCYRDAHFESCIGALDLGDSSHFVLTLDNTGAVETFLPQGGTPAALDMWYYNPASTSAGVLGGQLTALSLSVAFDQCDASFGASDVALADLVAQSGSCQGWTVQQIIDEGTCVISGRSDCVLTPSQINECLSSSNETFIDGSPVLSLQLSG